MNKPVFILVLTLIVLVCTVICLLRTKKENYTNSFLLHAGKYRIQTNDTIFSNRINIQLPIREIKEMYEPRNPIIIVPGLGGEDIWAKWNYSKEQADSLPDVCWNKMTYWDRIWPAVSVLYYILPEGECIAHRLKTLYDSQSKTFSNQPNVQTTAGGCSSEIAGTCIGNMSDFGSLGGMDKISILGIHVLQEMIDFLKKDMGYTEGADLFGAIFDFRLVYGDSNFHQYALKLKGLIEKAYNNTGKPVHIITHSFGAVLVQRFLSEWLILNLGNQTYVWKKKYIASWISVSGALGGSPMISRALLSGLNMRKDDIKDQQPGKDNNSFLFFMQSVIKTTSAVYGCFPNSKIYGNLPLVSLDLNNFQSSSYLNLLMNNPNTSNILQSYQDLVSQRVQRSLMPPGVVFTSIVSTCNAYETEGPCYYQGGDLNKQPVLFSEKAWYTYNGMVKTPEQNIIFANEDLNKIKGDGTVPWMAQMTPKLWQSKGKYRNIDENEYIFDTEIYRLEGGSELNHANMIRHPSFMQLLKQVLQKTHTMTEPEPQLKYIMPKIFKEPGLRHIRPLSDTSTNSQFIMPPKIFKPKPPKPKK